MTRDQVVKSNQATLRSGCWANCLTLTLVSCTLLSGCKTPPPYADRGHVNQEIQCRMFGEVATNSCPGEISIPPNAVMEDGLTEEEAVALALWNNRDFLATLSNLGIARGDLVQAGLLSNPQLNLLFPPIGSKQLEWTLFVPLEAIILRQQRVEIADQDYQRVCNELVQNGLNVARDARVAFADFQFAVDRHNLAQEAVEVRGGIADLAEKRLEAGDIGELEAITTRVDVNRSRAEAAGLEQAVKIAEAQLKLAIGIAGLDTPLYPVSEKIVPVPDFEVDSLISEALAIRPDIKAARVSIQAAQHREELARKSFLRIDAVADGNSGGGGPTNSGPGLRFEIPIFNRNQGLIIRSQWTLDQASHNYQAARDRVITEVRTSLAGVEQANSNLDLLREKVLPDLKDTVELSEASYRDGGDGYFLVLQATSQFIDSRIRELELEADLRRASAELDGSVGRRVMNQFLVEERFPELQVPPVLDTGSIPGPLLLKDIIETSRVGSLNSSANVTIIAIQPDASNSEVNQTTIADSLRSAAEHMRGNTEDHRSEAIVPSSFEP